jgi:hypothetical protein
LKDDLEVMISTVVDKTTTEKSFHMEDLLNVTVPALTGTNLSQFNMEESNKALEESLLQPVVHYNEEEKTLNAIGGAVKALFTDPDAQVMVAVTIGIGKKI